MTLLSIDPGRSYKGEKTIGYCLFDNRGTEIERGEMSWEDLVVRLSADEDFWFNDSEGVFRLIKEVVIEDFVNDPRRGARGGQRNGTSECIGAVEILCAISKTPFTRQPSSTLGPAKLHAPEGSWRNLQHLRHEDSAFLHGYEYLVGKGVLQSAGLSSTL